MHLHGRSLLKEVAFTKEDFFCLVELADEDQRAHVTYLGPEESQLGHKESPKDTARVLGRTFDGIEYCGFAQDIVEALAKCAGVPVWRTPT
jgi:ornithine carbamoyltransferase